ncbi:MAG: P27 family phage terminase small subunit [Porticoccus sp.]
MARKALPTQLKIVKGTDQKCRTNTAEPKPESKLPPCPSWVHGEGKKEWKRLSKELIKTGVVTGFDFIGLATLCHMWGEYVEGAQTGEPVSVAHITQMRLYLVEFGMTPSSRSKVHAGDGDRPKDPWDDF